MNIVEGKLLAQGLKFGIVVARFNEFITSKLLSGAEDTLVRHGAREEDITLPGCPVLLRFPWSQRKWPKAVNMMESSALVLLSAAQQVTMIMSAMKFPKELPLSIWKRVFPADLAS